MVGIGNFQVFLLVKVDPMSTIWFLHIDWDYSHQNLGIKDGDISELVASDGLLEFSHLVNLDAFSRRSVMPKNSLFLSINYNGNLDICTVKIYIG